MKELRRENEDLKRIIDELKGQMAQQNSLIEGIRQNLKENREARQLERQKATTWIREKSDQDMEAVAERNKRKKEKNKNGSGSSSSEKPVKRTKKDEKEKEKEVVSCTEEEGGEISEDNKEGWRKKRNSGERREMQTRQASTSRKCWKMRRGK